MTIYRGYYILTKLEGSSVVVYKITKKTPTEMHNHNVHMSFHEAFKFIDVLEGTRI